MKNGYGVNAMPTAVTERWSLSVAEMSRSAGYTYADRETTAQWFAFRQDYDLLILNWMLTKISGLIKSAKFLKAISFLSNHR